MKYTLFFLLATALFATDKVPVIPGCPITIRQFSGSYVTDVTVRLGMFVVNVSDKTIDAMKLKGSYTSPFNEKSDFEYNTVVSESLKAHKHVSWVYDTGVVIGTPIRSTSIWLDQVSYSDGTTWKDDGTHKCVFTSMSKH